MSSNVGTDCYDGALGHTSIVVICIIGIGEPIHRLPVGSESSALKHDRSMPALLQSSDAKTEIMNHA